MADAGDVRRMQAIIARLRNWDVVVREMPNWQIIGLTWARVPVGIIDHHDASSIKSGEWGSLGVIYAGRPDVPPPLSQFQVARCLDNIPKVAIIAAGRANHAGAGWYRFPDGLLVPTNEGNSWMYGAEKANNGIGEQGNEAHHYATDALFRTVLEVCG